MDIHFCIQKYQKKIEEIQNIPSIFQFMTSENQKNKLKTTFLRHFILFLPLFTLFLQLPIAYDCPSIKEECHTAQYNQVDSEVEDAASFQIDGTEYVHHIFCRGESGYDARPVGHTSFGGE